MNKDRIDELLEQAREKHPAPASEFCSATEFKQMFFRRSRMQSAKARPLRRAIWGLAAASLLLIAGVAVLLGSEEKRQAQEGEAADRLRQLVALFSPDSGIGMVNGEPVTFDRQNGRPTRMVELAVYDRNDRQVAILELAAGADDYFELTADRLKGAVSLQRGPDRDQILEFSLALTLGNGETVKLHTIAEYANGDARTALNTLEAAVEFSPEADGVTEVPEDILDGNMGRRSVLYDKHGEEHYNIIAAFHEGMRNSDPDAALYWLARMLDGGEDPCYIARRLIEAAAETVGLADNTALRMATSCYYACQELGEHECWTILAETAIYMSLAPRTNGVPMALGRAFWDVHHNPAEPVPMQIRNAPTKLMKQLDYGKGYQYAEDADEKMTKMQCLPDSLKDRRYYEPGPKGDERFYRRRLDAIRDWRSGKRENPPRRCARSFFKALRTRGSSRQLWPL